MARISYLLLESRPLPLMESKLGTPPYAKRHTAHSPSLYPHICLLHCRSGPMHGHRASPDCRIPDREGYTALTQVGSRLGALPYAMHHTAHSPFLLPYICLHASAPAPFHTKKPLGETFPPAVAAPRSTVKIVKIGDLAIVQTEHQATVLGQSYTANHRHQILASSYKSVKSQPPARPNIKQQLSANQIWH
jgi:hypothetical protein